MNNVYYTMNKVFLIFILSLTILSCTSSSTEEKPVKVVEDEKEKEKEEAIAVSHGAFTDSRDGKTYKTITINGQTWMNENLNFEIPDSSFCYQGKEENCDKRGRNYNWSAAKIACPDGWSLPSKEDYELLLKNASIENNRKGLTKLVDLGVLFQPAGRLLLSWSNTEDAYYWLNNEFIQNRKKALIYSFKKRYISQYKDDKKAALSCRCVKDK